jgi:hypothetical protein
MSFESSAARLSSPAYGRNETPSMAATLPSIEFGFESLKDRMAQFTIRFDEFIAHGRRRILEDRNDFAKTMAELKGANLHDNRGRHN